MNSQCCCRQQPRVASDWHARRVAYTPIVLTCLHPCDAAAEYERSTWRIAVAQLQCREKHATIALLPQQ
jgi:hypothetical protein